jgi:hypothetical protein
MMDAEFNQVEEAVNALKGFICLVGEVTDEINALRAEAQANAQAGKTPFVGEMNLFNVATSVTFAERPDELLRLAMTGGMSPEMAQWLAIVMFRLGWKHCEAHVELEKLNRLIE